MEVIQKRKERLTLISASKYRGSTAQRIYRHSWTMHDLGAQHQGGRKTGVPEEKPSDSDRDGQISAHMQTPGVDPGS